MSLIADGLLIATCLTAALYCYVLSRRLKQFSNTEDGVGKQVRDLNLALEETRAALKEAQSGAAAASEALGREIESARKAAAELEASVARTSEVSKAVPPPSEPAPARRAVPEAPPAETGATDAGKLAAVQHVDPGRTEPDEADEPDDDDLEDINLDDVLDATPGEQQLGFLPESLGTDDDVELDDSGKTGAKPDPDRGAGSEKLMKVERMAL